MNTTLPKDGTSKFSRGYLICIAATALWSSTAIFISYLTENYHVPALVLAFWRDLFVFGGLLCALIVFKRELLHPNHKHIPFFVLYGVELAIFNSLYTLSVALNGAAISTILAYSSAGFTVVLGWKIFNERLTLAKISAVFLSLVGCVFVSGAYIPATLKVNLWGILAGLGSGLAFAGYSLFGKAASDKKINPWQTLLFSFFFAAISLLVINLLIPFLSHSNGDSNLLWLGTQWAGWLILLFLAIVPTIWGFGFYTVSLTYLPASVANLIATLEPAMTLLLATIFLGERLTAPQFLGSLLIVTGVVLLRVSEGRNGRI